MSTELQTVTSQPLTQLQQPEIGYFTAGGFALLQRVGGLFAESSVVPETFSHNLPNCVIAVNMANRMKADPLMVMQNMYIVYGNPSFSSKFLIACFNNTGKFSALRYEELGTRGKDDWGFRAYATELKTGEKLVGPAVTIGIARKEGWYDKKGSKWQSMPELMLRYRSASQFIKLFAPEISMGMQTTEELEDTIELKQNQAGTFVPVTDVEVKTEKTGNKAQMVAEAIIAETKEKIQKAEQKQKADGKYTLKDVQEWTLANCNNAGEFESALALMGNFVEGGKLDVSDLQPARDIIVRIAKSKGINI